MRKQLVARRWLEIPGGHHEACCPAQLLCLHERLEPCGEACALCCRWQLLDQLCVHQRAAQDVLVHIRCVVQGREEEERRDSGVDGVSGHRLCLGPECCQLANAWNKFNRPVRVEIRTHTRQSAGCSKEVHVQILKYSRSVQPGGVRGRCQLAEVDVTDLGNLHLARISTEVRLTHLHKDSLGEELW